MLKNLIFWMKTGTKNHQKSMPGACLRKTNQKVFGLDCRRNACFHKKRAHRGATARHTPVRRRGGHWRSVKGLHAMENDVLPVDQRRLDERHRCVQLALPKPLRSRVHPHVIRLAVRRTRWVIEPGPRVCALHNEPHHRRMFFPPPLALHLALLREYHASVAWLLAAKRVEMRGSLPLLLPKS